MPENEPARDGADRRFQDLFERAAVGMGETDATGRLTAVNERFCRITGYSRNELLAMDDPLQRLTHPEDMEVGRDQVERLRRGDTDSFRFEKRYRRKDGRTIWVRVSASAIRDVSGHTERLVGVIEDIDAHKRVERQNQLRAAQQAAIAELGQQALAADDLQGLLDRAVRTVAATLGNELCKVLRLLPGEEELVLEAGVGWREGLIGRATVDTGDNSQAGHTLRNDEPVIVEDLRHETRFAGPPLLREHGVVSGMSVIIGGAGGEPWGVLSTHSTRRVRFTEDDVNFLQAVANVLAEVIQRMRGEEALRSSERREKARADELATVMEAVPALILIAHDPGATRISGNRAACELLRAPAGANLSLNAPPEQRPRHFALYRDGRRLPGHELPIPRAARGERIEDFEYWIVFEDGEERCIVGHAVPLRDEQGESAGAVGAFIDITERKQAEENLAHERALLRGIVDNIPVLLVTWAPNFEHFTLNRYAEQVLGWTTEEANEGDFMQKVYPDPDYRAEVEAYMRSMGQDWGEWVITTREGERVPIDWANVRLTDETMIGIGVDLRERKRAEEALRRSEEQRRTALEAAEMGTWDYDQSNGLVYWDRRTAELFGLEGRDAVPLNQVLAQIHEDDREQVRQQVEAATRPDFDDRYDIEYRVTPRNREQRWVRAVGQTIFQDAGEQRRALRFVGVVYDTTEARRQREALRELNETLEQRVAERTELANRRAEQLQALATQLTQVEQRERRRLAQVLHDHFQQILVTAKMQAGSMNTDDEEARERHQGQLSDLLDDAVSTSRNLSHELYPPVLYDRGLAEGLRWLGRRFSDQGVLRVEVEADPAAEPADQDLQAFFYQAAQELLLNAIKHGGADRAWVKMGDRKGSLTLSVRDNGRGCEPERVFDQPKRGAFGLFSIQERLNMLGGSMSLRAAPDAGCTVTLRLSGEGAASSGGKQDATLEPTDTASDRQTEPSRREAPQGEAEGKSQPIRVMLADDHKIVREGLAGILHAEPGIEPVAEASDGREVVELVEQTRPDVIVMDVSMPRMDGAEATRIVLTKHPEIRVIGLSMHERGDLEWAMKEAGAVAYLTKGGPSSELVAAIRQYGQGQPAG